MIFIFYFGMNKKNLLWIPANTLHGGPDKSQTKYPEVLLGPASIIPKLKPTTIVAGQRSLWNNWLTSATWESWTKLKMGKLLFFLLQIKCVSSHIFCVLDVPSSLIVKEILKVGLKVSWCPLSWGSCLNLRNWQFNFKHLEASCIC